MNEQKNNNGRGIFYGVIGVATLVVAIIGATFAYFTATQNAGNNVITGNMASISFGLKVQKVTKADEKRGGMIPMSNNMVEAAVHGTYPGGESATKSDSGSTATDYTYGAQNICTDDNGNAVCQVYKIVVNNEGSAGMFVDGFVTLTGGSGTPNDAGKSATKNLTTMRWAQVFCEGPDDALTSCTTAGTSTTESGVAAWDALDADKAGDGFYNDAILTADALGTPGSYASITGTSATTVVASAGTIFGNTYPIISQNYIRISNHDASANGYTRTADMTSALVLNQNLAAKRTNQTAFADLDSSAVKNGNAASPDAKAYYIVVWLSENGFNQNPDSTAAANTPNIAQAPAVGFFTGNVTFNSAQGSEVTATFSGYAAVQSDTTRS